MAKDDGYKDPFPNLPRRSAISRQFVDEKPSPKPPKVDKAKAVLAKAEKAAKPLAKPKPRGSKRGRPPAPKPWEAEGISRQAWYKRGHRKAGDDQA